MKIKMKMTRSEFLWKYTEKFNEQQLEAIQTTQGPILLLAVPGSGKTTVLVHRLGYMVFCEEIDPSKILTLTYTVAATRDMKERFLSVFGKEYDEMLEFRTINGICAKIIQEYGNNIGKQPFELVTEEKKTGRILAEILRNNGINFPTESDIRGTKTLITYCKNMMLSKEEVETLGKKEGFCLFPVLEQYNAYLRSNSLMDYDDQMMYAYRMLKSDPSLLLSYRKRYSYLCVDEAQDTSKIQHEIIGLLAGKNGNLFMVGDEDQSIYGFRAAYPEALLHFEQKHEKARVLVMNQNYRSNARIVEAADRLIQRNQLRHAKTIKATREYGEEILYPEVNTRANQYSYLLKVAQQCEKETAVLYRENESILPLVDELERRKIPYRIKSVDMNFFTHPVVMDVTNILLFALDPFNTSLFMQIYYKCKTFLKKNQAEQVCRISEEKKIPVLDAVDYVESITGMVRGKCKSLQTNLRKMKKENPGKAIFRIEVPLGYEEYMERNGMDGNKVFILKMLAQKETSIYGFLERLDYLDQVLKTRRGVQGENFILSTIHSSKGLEYEQVYLMDVCDGVFPKTVGSDHTKTREEEQREREEERRLFYVGITRAKERLFIFRIKKETSCFLKEICPPVQKEKSNARANVVQSTFPKTKYKISEERIFNTKENDLRHRKIKATLPEVLVIGQKVSQTRYGQGIITDVTYEGNRILSFQVTFNNGQEKDFAYPIAFTCGMSLLEE